MVEAEFILLRAVLRPVLGGAAALSAVAASPVFANPAPAGTLIESTAEAQYEEAGTARSVTSNTVQVRVDELLSVGAATLEAGSVTVQTGPKALAFLVSNTGNGPEAFTLDVVTAVAGNGFDTTLDAIAVDSNGNGVYDPGADAVLPGPSVTAPLGAGASQRVFVIVNVPSGISDGAQSAVELVARTATGTGAPGTVFAGAGEGGGDAVVGAGGGTAIAATQLVASASTVTLVKWASVSDPFGGSSGVPGATITYAIQVAVSGSASVDNLVVTDAIPSGTGYIANSLRLDAAALTDAPGDDAGEASPAGIAVNLGSVPGGTSTTVTFAVLVEK